MTTDTTARQDARVATTAATSLRALIAAERGKPQPDRTWLASAESAVAEWDRQGSRANAAMIRGLADAAGPLAAPSWGAAFTTSSQWRTRRGGYACAPVQLDGYLEERAQAVPLAPGAAGGGLGAIALRCGAIPSAPGDVTLLRWQGPLVPAAPQAAPEALKAPGGQAPVLTPVVAPTIAAWVPATRQVLDDAAALASVIDNRLRRALALSLDNEIVNLITADAAVPPADSVLAAIGALAAEGHAADLTVILNPEDYATADQVADLLALGVGAVLASAELPAGTAITGSLTAGVQLRVVGGATVLVSDSHADMFLRNELVILAEQRVASGVADPWALRLASTGAATRTAGKRAA